MNHDDHMRLLREGVLPGGTWADLGSGTGAFTLALADLAGNRTRIYSVDRDQRALSKQQQQLESQFPQTDVVYMHADFNWPLELPPLDGVVMANALHFQREKEQVLGMVRGYLKPGGRLVLVEYNSDHGNFWVPHPISYPTWENLAGRTGFKGTKLLAAVPSRFLREIYSALSFNF